MPTFIFLLPGLRLKEKVYFLRSVTAYHLSTLNQEIHRIVVRVVYVFSNQKL